MARRARETGASIEMPLCSKFERNQKHLFLKNKINLEKQLTLSKTTPLKKGHIPKTDMAGVACEHRRISGFCVTQKPVFADYGWWDHTEVYFVCVLVYLINLTLFKDGAYYSGFLWVVPTYTGIFLRGLKLYG